MNVLCDKLFEPRNPDPFLSLWLLLNRQKMRILFITHFYPPTRIAGTENYTQCLARAFHAKGHQVEVLCSENWDTGSSYWNGTTEEINNGVVVHRIHLNWTKADNPNEALYYSALIESWLYDFLKNRGRFYDVVHVTSAMTLGVGILRSVKRAGIPLILTLMDFWFICPSIQLLRSDGSLCDGRTTVWECHSCMLANLGSYQKIRHLHIPLALQHGIFRVLSRLNVIAKKRGLRGMLLNIARRKRLMAESLLLPDRVLTHSQIVQKMISLNHSIRVDVLRNGHAEEGRGPRLVKTDSPLLRFGYLGQILPSKGVHVLIRAFLKANIEAQSRLDIWGDLTAQSGYTRAIQSISDRCQSIRFNGRFDRKLLASILAAIDVVIVPSLWYENAPLVIQEALAAQCPVIATKLGGMEELVQHGINGLLFQRGDADDLARQLRRLVDEPGLLERLRAGVSAVKTIEQEVEELEAIYAGILRVRSAS
jgi:glycosyltransferase involved in cell wall biosynthesis